MVAVETSAWTGPTTGALLDGRYRLVGRIGRGGMADVWAAEDEVLRRRVAVKLFRFDTPAADEQRIEAEIRTIAQLHHPGIVTVYDAGAAVDADAAPGHRAGGPYLVMELVDGQPLSDRLAGGPLPPNDVERIAAQLVSALAYVHGQGVVHRDVKPANILLPAPRPGDTAGVTAKLTDFGIARLVDSTRHTAAGMTLGTANYLSPEQATGAPVGPAGDIYSLGLVLLECLTGQVAYPGVGVEAALARLHRPPVVPAQVGPRWVDLLTAMTASRPQDRPTAVQLGDVLASGQPPFPGPTARPAATTALLTSQAGPADGTRLLPGTASGPGGPVAASDATWTATPHPPWRRRYWLLAAALAVALVILVAVLVSRSSGAGAPPAPKPTYPTVPGPLGQHLHQLEGAVG